MLFLCRLIVLLLSQIINYMFDTKITQSLYKSHTMIKKVYKSEINITFMQNLYRICPITTTKQQHFINIFIN